MTDTLSSVQGWAARLDATLTGLPSALQQVAPSGDFSSVLASVQEMLAAGPGSFVGSALSTGSPSAAAQDGVPGASGGLGSAAVADAERYLGVPYQWGGSSPAGFDCSGLVQYVYGQLGISLPRTSQEQANVGTPVDGLANAQPGDLVFFAGSDGTATAPGHVGIYVGNGEMIDAPYTGASVRIEPVGDPVAIRRVVPSGGGPGVAAVGWPSGIGTAGLSSAVLTTAQPGSTNGSAQVPSDLAPLFVSAAGQHGVPVTLLTAVAQQESGFDPNAVSSAGAEGIMQLMPGTAAGLGVNPFDPAQAISGAAQLLSGYLQQFGSVPMALAAYNAGPAAVQQYGGVPPYPETQQYVSSIMAQLGGGS